jgi:hypothetical protein
MSLNEDLERFLTTMTAKYNKNFEIVRFEDESFFGFHLLGD